MVDVTSAAGLEQEFAPRSGGTPARWRGLVVPAAFLLGWAVVTHAGMVRSPLAVPIERIVLLPFADEAGRQLWLALAASVGRLIVGFGIGVVAGVALGLAMGMSSTADRAVGASFHALRQITLFAWIPLLTAWFGNGELGKLVYIALSAFFPAALNTCNGLRTIPQQYIEVARVMRLGRRETILRLLLPGALPSIFVGMQIALITAWIGTVGAEYAIGNGRGIGNFIAEGREQFRMDIVIVGVTALALVGYAVNLGCRRVFRRALGRSDPA